VSTARNTVNVEQLFRSAATQAVSYDRGTAIFSEGDEADALYVVISGRVVLSQQTEGRQKILAVLKPGDFLGAVGAVTGRLHAATARTVDEATLVRMPAGTAVATIAASPDYSAALIRQLCSYIATLEGGAEAPGDFLEAAHSGTYDHTTFYATERVCPICSVEFSSLSARSKAIASVKRDSDFHYWYKGVNPAHYAVVVCPHCRYAALGEEFEGVPPRERSVLLDTARERQQFAAGQDLSGERAADGVRLSIELAIMSHDARGGSRRKRGALYQRLAWVEREDEHADAEARYLRLALTDYEITYQNDTISDAAAVNLAYLIADLSLRLGDREAAVRWFDTVSRMPELRNHPEIQRLTRQQWSDLREQMRS
jgi:uncharacterized protein (DUF2225 family)